MATTNRNFLQDALAYAGAGWRVFPCRVDEKIPASAHGCKDATTDLEQVRAWWGENPKYNLGISTDGLVVLDIDPVDGGENPFLASLPDDLASGPSSLTPRQGRHFWFRQDGSGYRNTTSRVAPAVDTRADGGYVLAPPSIVNGKPYAWIVPPGRPSELPVVPEWLSTRLLCPASRLLSVDIVNGVDEAEPTNDGDFSANGSTDGAWGKNLTPPLADETGPIPEGRRNETLHRMACALRSYGLSEAEIAPALAAINNTRCSPPLPDCEVLLIVKSASRFTPDAAKAALVAPLQPRVDGILKQSIGLAMASLPPEEGEFSVEPEFDATLPDAVFSGMPRLMRQAMDWTMATAIKPQREITLGALLAMFGAVFGRKVRDEYGTRPNIMTLGLAPSGAGKEHPRQAVKRILYAAGLAHLSGPERIGSSAGIISSVSESPVRLFQVDEFGRLLHTMKSATTAHLYNIGTVLMQLYSSSGTTWTGDAYADLGKVKTINQPGLCVFGTAVTDGFYSGLAASNVTDGLLSRMLVFESPGYTRWQTPDDTEIPTDLIEMIRAWHGPTVGGNLTDVNPNPLLVQKTTEAKELYESYAQEVYARHKGEETESASLWSRAAEKVNKLSLIYACCDSYGGVPVVSVEAVRWAKMIVNHATRLVLSRIDGKMVLSRWAEEKNRAWAKLQGEQSLREFTRRTQWLRTRERQELLEEWAATGAIRIETEQTSGRPRQNIVRLRKFL